MPAAPLSKPSAPRGFHLDAPFCRNAGILATAVFSVLLFGFWICSPDAPPNGPGIYYVVVAESWASGPGNYPHSSAPTTDRGQVKIAVPVSHPNNPDRTFPMLVDPWEYDRFRPGEKSLVDQGFSIGRVRPVRSPGYDLYGRLLWLRWRIFG